MLDSMRKRATGTMARVLFGLLALSFAIWGIGPTIRNSGSTDVVAKVGGLPITAPALRREADLGYQQLQRQYGMNIPRDDSISATLIQQALQSAISRRLLDAHAHDLGLVASDVTLAKRVHEEPAFQGAAGFDRSRFDMFLRSSGMDEGGFVQQLRMDVTRGDLVNSLIGPVVGSDTVARMLENYRGELRSGRALVVTAADLPVEPPDDTALEAFLDSHAGDFKTPELRTVQLVTLTPSDLAGEIKVDDAAVRAEYDAHMERYRTPEQRWITQLLAPNEAALRHAAELVGKGQSFEDAAKALASEGVTTAELGPVAKGALPEPVEQAAFGQQIGAVGEPVQSAFGWHLVRVDKVEPEHVVPYDLVRGDIEHELALRQAADRLPKAATALDDALAGGADLAEAAHQAGGELRTITIDRSGKDGKGAALQGAPLSRAILDEIFAAQPGETSLVQPDENGGYHVFSVTSIEPARPQTLAEAHDQVLAAWRHDEQEKLAKEEAERLLADARNGKPLAELAASAPGAKVVELKPTRRDANASDQPLGPGVHDALFSTAPGQVADKVVEVPGGVAIVATDETVPADASASVADARRTLQAAMRNDIAQSYESALRARYPIETNARALGALLPQSAR